VTRHAFDTQHFHNAFDYRERALLMPMTPLLDRPEFDPETKRAMHTAFEMAREALQLDEQINLAERVAKTIVEVAKTGERNSDLLCECVLREFRRHL